MTPRFDFVSIRDVLRVLPSKGLCSIQLHSIASVNFSRLYMFFRDANNNLAVFFA